MNKEVIENLQQEKENAFTQNLKRFLQSLDDVKRRNLDIENAVLDRGPAKNGYYPIDVTYKSIISNKHGKPTAFLLCSNPDGKDLIFRNVNQAKKIKNSLSVEINSVITLPFCDGYFEGISWAMFYLHRPLAGSKLQWAFQRSFLTPIIAKWLRMSLLETKTKIPTEKIQNFVIKPLQALESSPDFPDNIRNKTAEIINRLGKDDWQPHTAMAHNDLWKGNILLPQLRTNPLVKFKIIDWAGSNLHGIPFFDLIKFCQSFKVPKFYSKLLIKQQCDILNCEIEDSLSYLVTSLAILGQNLDQFPRNAYIRLSKGLFALNQS
ncbi:MAG: hypothetical protein K8R68_06685, partial [Bacteroidales bacterium]|nr:hypothetical protein [Bacteroidales bacterium]